MRLVSGGRVKFGGGEFCLSYFLFASGIWFGVLDGRCEVCEGCSWG
jgi:hypothetical protein